MNMIKKGGMNLLACVCKPLLIALLILGVFGLVYLRSSFLRLEYSLGDLEKKKMNYLKERKILLAEKTKLLSFAQLETSHDDSEGFSLPDRIKVIHLEKQIGSKPYKASLETSQLVEP
jgi:hypothetical protein